MKKLYFIIMLSCCKFAVAQSPVTYPDNAGTYAGGTANMVKPLQNDAGDSIVLDTFFFNPSHITKIVRYSYNIGFSSYNWLRITADSFFYGLDTVKYVACNNYGCDTGIIFVVVDFKFYDTCAYLDINKVSARFNTGGSNFWDLKSSSKYEVPKGSGIYSIFAESVWIGGKNDANGLHLVAQRYKDNGEEFYPGPIMDSAVFPPSVPYAYQYEIQKWNRMWKVNKSDIDFHIASWNQPGYVIPEVILNWPAHGDTALKQVYELAPFYDYNSDGKYNPDNGDYPIIRGDQTVYFIMNDINLHEQTGGAPLKTEIHGTAYAFNCSDSALQHTIFINYKFINRSDISYYDTYIGLWVDGDLGNFFDDYVGCDLQRGSFYFYNGDNLDENSGGATGYGSFPPAQSATILAGPHQDSDGFDNTLIYDYNLAFSDNGIPYPGLGWGYSDNIIDNERIGLAHFTYYNNGSCNTVCDPDNAAHYYNYISGYWKDGTQMVYGGNGHISGGGTIPAKYMFPDDTDPLGWGTSGNVQPVWNEVSSGNTPSDRRGIGSVGPFTFESGEIAELDVAFVFGRDYQTTGPAAGVTVMQQRIDAIREMFANDSTPCGGKFFTSKSEISNLKSEILIYPNPATENITVLSESKNSSFEIYDLTGRKISEGKIISTKQNISLKNFGIGIYFIRISDGEKIISKKFVKE